MILYLTSLAFASSLEQSILRVFFSLQHKRFFVCPESESLVFRMSGVQAGGDYTPKHRPRSSTTTSNYSFAKASLFLFVPPKEAQIGRRV